MGTLRVECSEALARIKKRKAVVTVVPIQPSPDGPQISGALRFDSVRLVTYEQSVTA